MHKFKVSEIFLSAQGENLYVGTPSIFVRLFGCNFQCAGFGMRRGELSEERFNVDPKDFKDPSDYNKLPLVSTGCDSYASWDVRFKHLSPIYTTEELVKKIVNLLPSGTFSRDVHLILTGGEPLLGWQRGFPELIEELRVNYNLSHVTFETNGTQELIPALTQYIKETPTIEFFFSISSKLTVSGEDWDAAIKPYTVADYFVANNVTGSFKFVVASQEDMDDVARAVSEYKDAGVDISVYLMPLGGVDEVYYFNNKTVAELAIKHGYRYSPRLQIDLWKNAWAT